MSDPLLEAGFDHPCRETCSGWKQGYERGNADALVEAMELMTKLVDSLQEIASVKEMQVRRSGPIWKWFLGVQAVLGLYYASKFSKEVT